MALAMLFVPKKLFQWLRMKKDSDIRSLTKASASGVISALRFVRLRQKGNLGNLENAIWASK